MATEDERFGVADEDLAVRLGRDYETLTDRSDALAYATDGVLAEAEPWTISSATLDFDAADPPARSLLAIQPATQQPGAAAVPRTPTTPLGQGDLLVIDSFAGHAATLRRKGKDPGAGRPPCPPGGATGVRFWLPSAEPKIADAARYVGRLFGKDDRTQLGQPDDFFEAVLLRVRFVLYEAAARQATAGANKDDWWAKAREAKKELDAELARLATAYGAGPGEGPGVGGASRVRLAHPHGLLGPPFHRPWWDRRILP